MLKSYILTKDFSSPYVVSTGLAHKPTQIKLKKFRRGEIINGEMKHANNQPAFVLVGGTLMIPLAVIREVVTKEINSGADGSGSETKEAQKAQDRKPALVVTQGKLKGIDAMLIGAVVGVVGVVIAEKQTWLAPSPSHKNKLIGGFVGAIAGLYLSYRLKK